MDRKNVVALVLACAVGAAVGKLYSDRRNAPPSPVSLPAPEWPLGQAIDEATDYMARATGESGRVVYTMAVDGLNVKPSRYNVVRHAGAIYALADAQVEAPSEAKRAAARAASTRAADYLVKTYVRPPKAHPDMLAVWSDPKEEGGSRPSAKLGGSGLGLIGLMGRYRAEDGGPAAGDLSVMRGLGRFVVFMQKDTGDFVSKFTDEGGKSSEFESLYYPGEAMLGMTMLYEVDRDPAWLRCAAKGIAYLVTSRKGTAKLPADHWLMIAIDRFLPLYAEVADPPIAKADILQHAIDLGRMMIEGQTETAASHPEYAGCYTNDGRTTPSATRLEGLLALEHSLAAEGALHAEVRKEVRASIEKGIQFLRRSQHVAGPVRGGFPQTFVAPGDTEGGKKQRDDSEDDRPGDHRGEVRIDYTQHAVSALMRYRRMCTADPTGCQRP